MAEDERITHREIWNPEEVDLMPDLLVFKSETIQMTGF